MTYLDYASDEKKAVVLKHFPDRMQSMVIDTATRKRKMVIALLSCICLFVSALHFTPYLTGLSSMI